MDADLFPPPSISSHPYDFLHPNPTLIQRLISRRLPYPSTSCLAQHSPTHSNQTPRLLNRITSYIACAPPLLNKSYCPFLLFCALQTTSTQVAVSPWPGHASFAPATILVKQFSALSTAVDTWCLQHVLSQFPSIGYFTIVHLIAVTLSSKASLSPQHMVPMGYRRDGFGSFARRSATFPLVTTTRPFNDARRSRAFFSGGE